MTIRWQMQEFAGRMKKEYGRKHVTAITYVANNMIRIIWAMLTVREPYKSHSVQRYDRKMKRMGKIRQSMSGMS